MYASARPEQFSSHALKSLTSPHLGPDTLQLGE
jgi:hypothetical protein